jgi:urease accessory protein
MLRATSVLPREGWRGAPADSIVLDHDDRYRRRMAMTGVQGLEFLLDLPDAVMLRTGDALALEDGRLVEVVAAPEELAEIRCASPEHLARVAWHLGNRHLPAQIVGQKLRIRRDHVIEEMVAGLGAKVTTIEAPFDPEGGAYAQPVAGHGHDHGHEHGHDHGHHHGHDHHGHDHHGHDHHGHDHAGCCGGHDHAHDHGHDHAQEKAHAHDHDHAHGCGCDHKHG